MYLQRRKLIFMSRQVEILDLSFSKTSPRSLRNFCKAINLRVLFLDHCEKLIRNKEGSKFHLCQREFLFTFHFQKAAMYFHYWWSIKFLHWRYWVLLAQVRYCPQIGLNKWVSGKSSLFFVCWRILTMIEQKRVVQNSKLCISPENQAKKP